MGNVLWILAFMLSAVVPIKPGDFDSLGKSEVSVNSRDVDIEVVADELTLTILYDNSAHIEGVEPAWGFSCLVSTSDANILFDCGGDGGVLLSNMEKVRYVAPCHCSGERASAELNAEFGDHLIDVGAGSVITLSDLRWKATSA
ncbi:MAG: hypothetical protein AB1744_13925, partial [Candidatus Zixiibacteriota bacterium]